MRWRGRRRRRMYPQPSCSVSNMAPFPLREKRDTEQINNEHQIPPHCFTLRGLRSWEGIVMRIGGGGGHEHGYSHLFVCVYMLRTKSFIKGDAGRVFNGSLSMSIIVRDPPPPRHHLPSPSLAPVQRVMCVSLHLCGPACLRLLSAAGSLWSCTACRNSSDTDV